MIPSPRDNLYQKLIPLEIGDVATVATAWSSLGMELTASGIVATEAVGAAAILAGFGGGLALVGGALVLGAMAVAPFVDDESLLHDITEGITSVHPFLSPVTQLLVAVSAPFNGLLPTSSYSDPMALQKLGGAFGDLLTGGLSGSAGERLISVLGSAAGAPGWLEDAQNLQSYLNPPPQGASSGGSIPGSSAGPGSAGQLPSGLGAGTGSGMGFSPFAPGMGDSGTFSFGGDGSDGSSSSYGGDGLTMTITQGGSSMPSEPTPVDEPPVLPDPPSPPEPPSPPSTPTPPPPTPPPPPPDDDDDDDDDDE